MTRCLCSPSWGDCPGAVQITPAAQVVEMLGRSDGLEPVTDHEIGARIARLRDHTGEWTLPEEHWSLAGQQEKLALARIRAADGTQRWAEAKGSAPTTHIVQPGIGRLHHQALVEHATMRAAAALGVNVANTEGHAMNVSIRILPAPTLRMAPLYDLASRLPYGKATVDRRLALAIGGERKVDRIRAAQWARELG